MLHVAPKKQLKYYLTQTRTLTKCFHLTEDDSHVYCIYQLHYFTSVVDNINYDITYFLQCIDTFGRVTEIPHFRYLLLPEQIHVLHWALSASTLSPLVCAFSFSFLTHQ